MARHRKIDVRMWGDARFLALSRPQPNAQTLWVYLLTGPHTTSIPGLFTAGEAGLAEAMGWPLKGFREAFLEVTKNGMVEADWTARVVWIPKAIFYNPPESPNVVKSWRAYWDEIPECELKVKAYHHLKGFLEGFGKGFGEGYARACAAPGVHPSRNQEQEQEQEQDTPLTPQGGCVVQIPPELDTEEFRIAWGEWKADRSAKRIRPYTQTGEKEALRKLAKFGPSASIEAIHESIAQGWQGLFPKNATTASPTSNGSARESAIKAAIARGMTSGAKT